MTAPELLPCPFCGDNRASTYHVRDGRVSMCPACGAKSGSQFNGPLDLPSADDRAIAAWNRRTPSPEVAALIAEARREERERCAKECDRIAGNTKDFNHYTRRAAGMCAAALRALKDETP